MKHFELNISGHRYQGIWAAISTEAIEVRCEYGKRSVLLKGRAPAPLALATLATMVPANAS